MKQLALAEAMGVNQQTVSKLEASDTLDDIRPQEMAKALEVSVEAIKNFTGEAVITYFNTLLIISTHLHVIAPIVASLQFRCITVAHFNNRCATYQ
ncbi:MAG TPA: helix-turn-helix transcriptional regulator [Flavobacterium sp.]|jgi:transcriptional regulator with XRE-family HTH domain